MDIDLGGRIVKAIKAKPAHCNSTVFFFDEKEGLFMSGDDLECAQVMLHDNSNNPNAGYDVREHLENLWANTQMMKNLGDQIKYLLPNHNGTPISKEYIDEFIGLVDGIFAGTATIEDKLNHKYVEMSPEAPYLCRVRYKKASIFIRKDELMKVYPQKYLHKT